MTGFLRVRCLFRSIAQESSRFKDAQRFVCGALDEREEACARSALLSRIFAHSLTLVWIEQGFAQTQ